MYSGVYPPILHPKESIHKLWKIYLKCYFLFRGGINAI